MNKKEQYILISLSYGHQSKKEILEDLGKGLYFRYCLGDDYSKTASNYIEFKKLCEELKKEENNN